MGPLLSPNDQKMPQGNLKRKTSLPAGTKQKVKHKKSGVMKKGKRTIAPSKARAVEAEKLKQGLTQAINANIEQEIKAKAHNCELKSMQILKSQEAKPKHDKPK